MPETLSEFLVERGFGTVDRSDKTLASMDDAALGKLRDELCEQIVSVGRQAAATCQHWSLFNFFASSSFRGLRCCDHFECRAKKLGELSRFAALYCDHIIFPIELGHRFRPALDRLGFERTLRTLSLLLPLIGEGIIVPVPDSLYLCKEHAKGIREIADKCSALSDRLVKEHVSDFKLFYRREEIGGQLIPLIETTGPRHYIETGTQYRLLLREPEWANELPGGTRIPLPLDVILKQDLLGFVFKPAALDVVFQRHYAPSMGCTYLTDLEAEVEYFTAADASDELSSRANLVCADLSHSVPLFHEAPVETVLRVRRDEADAFATYRGALNRAAKELVASRANVDGRQLFGDFVLPELNKLRQKEAVAIKAASRSFGARMAASGLAVAVAVIGKQHLGSFSDVVTTCGGLEMLRDITEFAYRRRVLSSETESSDLAFLIHLERASLLLDK